MRTQTRLRPCRGSLPSCPGRLRLSVATALCFGSVTTARSADTEPPAALPRAVYRLAQDDCAQKYRDVAVRLLCNEFSQCGRRPACDPTRAVCRLAQDDCAQALQRLLARASTCSPVALSEQFNVLLWTASHLHIPHPHATHPALPSWGRADAPALHASTCARRRLVFSYRLISP